MNDIIQRAVEILSHDGVIIYPTDTIYGLGADAFSEEAILKIYEAKGRGIGNPISVAVCDADMIRVIAHVTPQAENFIEEFLPGPVTIVLKARSIIPRMLTGGTDRIGIRYPLHKTALAIIEAFDSPITATSANRSGARDPASPDECHVFHNYLIDEGVLPGIPSTVVDLVENTILRAGAHAERVSFWLEEI